MCVLVAHGTACLGPVTRAGCGALCPSVGRGCFGCFGPSEGANTAALTRRLRESGLDPLSASRLFATFYAGNSVFAEQSERLADTAESAHRGEGGDSPMTHGSSVTAPFPWRDSHEWRERARCE